MPQLDGACQLSVSLASPAVAVKFLGAPGATTVPGGGTGTAASSVPLSVPLSAPAANT